VVILIVHYVRVAIFEIERDSPVPANPNRPSAFPRSLQSMELEARDIHILDRRRGLKGCQLKPYALAMRRLDSRSASSLVEALKTLVTE
jgi:hypothetical protein